MALSAEAPTWTVTVAAVAKAELPSTLAVTVTVAAAASSAMLEVSTESVMPPGALSLSVMLKLAAPLPLAPPSRLAAASVPSPRLTDSRAPSSMASSLAVSVRVAELAALLAPEKAMVGGLEVRFVLERFE